MIQLANRRGLTTVGRPEVAGKLVGGHIEIGSMLFFC